MKPLDFANIFMILLLCVTSLNGLTKASQDTKDFVYGEFHTAFQEAVDDMGYYLSRLEAQQTQSGVRYSKERQLALDVDALNVFLDNLSMKFGIEGNATEVQNLLLHIPVMAFMKYDGYVLITLEDTSDPTNDEIAPVFWPKKPYTYTTELGYVLYLTLDDKLTLYDPNTNQYIKGSYEELRHVRDLSPIRDFNHFEEVRLSTIAKKLEVDLQDSMNRHISLMTNLGLSVDLYIPEGIDDQEFSGIGFLAFIQGYPLPGGQILSSVAFGGGTVEERDTYIGVIRSDGRHMAYPEKCGLPPGTYTVIETLRNDLEAARKGYFIEHCFRR